MNIAVIGATGFVGAHILSELLAREHELLGISRTMQIETNAIALLKIDVFNISILAKYSAGSKNNLNCYQKELECIAEHTLLTGHTFCKNNLFIKRASN